MGPHYSEHIDGGCSDCLDSRTRVSTEPSLIFNERDWLTVPCSYGTPFLLELGLPAQLTSLVWLAGPISGLVAQPVIGVFLRSTNLLGSSDLCCSLFHRCPFRLLHLEVSPAVLDFPIDRSTHHLYSHSRILSTIGGVHRRYPQCGGRGLG